METQETKEVKKIIRRPLQGVLKGKWKLEYTCRGTMGPENFGGITIHEYQNPKTGYIHRRPRAGGGFYPYYMLSIINKIFMPEEKLQDQLDVEWLIHHPEIALEGFADYPEYFQKIKNENSNIKLIALDFQELKKVDDADYIDLLVGRLSLAGGPKAIGLKRLRYILAELNLTYRDARYVTDSEVENKVLRSNLKNHIKKSLKNAKLVNGIIDNLDMAELTFQLKEFLANGIIVQDGPAYRYRNAPLAVSVNGIYKEWERDPNLRLAMQKDLEDKFK